MENFDEQSYKNHINTKRHKSNAGSVSVPQNPRDSELAARLQMFSAADDTLSNELLAQPPPPLPRASGPAASPSLQLVTEVAATHILQEGELASALQQHVGAPENNLNGTWMPPPLLEPNVDFPCFEIKNPKTLTDWASQSRHKTAPLKASCTSLRSSGKKASQ